MLVAPSDQNAAAMAMAMTMASDCFEQPGPDLAVFAGFRLVLRASQTFYDSILRNIEKLASMH